MPVTKVVTFGEHLIVVSYLSFGLIFDLVDGYFHKSCFAFAIHSDLFSIFRDFTP